MSAPLCATWSILIVDTATGEVAVGIATCLTFFDLRPCCVVIVPGVGVAAAQSYVGPLSLRQMIRAQLREGTAPAQILAMLQAADPGHQSRQYGIADVQGGTVTFTGTGAGAWAGGLTGQVGTLHYTIQGNVLTGLPVIQNAEQALINTPGDVGQKLMAAMEAARLMGGDGRCSCSQSNPPGCGSPPSSFTKSAHIGLMIVSRPGDVDVACSAASGCGGGTYYMDLNVPNQSVVAQDPVLQLQTMFNAWRMQQIGRPDHFQSGVSLSTPQLLSNGSDTSTATVTLRDLQGSQLTTSPSLTVNLAAGSTAADVQISPVTALGNGTYTFDVTSGLTPGQAILDVVAQDALGDVSLSPRPVLLVGDPFGSPGVGTIDDGQGGFADLLRIDGTAGTDRIVKLGQNRPFTLQLDAPPLVPPGTPGIGDFLLWVRAGVPGPVENLFLGPGVGTLCFSPPPLPLVAPTWLLADSLTGSGLLPATTAPWSQQLPGVPGSLDVTLQGVMIENQPLEIGVTNALLLRIVLLPPPVITQVTPMVASAGATVTVTGAGFQPGLVLDISGIAVAPSSVTDTVITFVMPPAAPCDATLTVTNVDNQSTSTIINPSPQITNTFLGQGSAAGGALFILLGSGFSPGSPVTIGGAPATVNTIQPGSLSVTTPPGSPGTVPVVVTSPTGCTGTTTYTYL
jgi:uncharacterized Ntn-hydrolase superfamily protein